MSDQDHQLDMLDKILARNVAWIASADTKATLLLAVDTAMLGTLAALIPTTNLWTSYSAVAAVLATIALLVSGGFVITAQYPRLEGPRGSLVYFEGIASNESDDYVNRILESDPKEILRDFARQCHRNAEIAKTKFGQIRYATICTFISLVPWLVAVSLLYHARLAAKGL